MTPIDTEVIRSRSWWTLTQKAYPSDDMRMLSCVITQER